MSIQKTLVNIIKTSKEDPKDVFQKLVKLQEEVGELSDAVLRRNGLKSPRNKNIKELEDDVLEEIVDVIIVATSLLPHFNLDITDTESKIETKFRKWKSNLGKHKEWQDEIKKCYSEVC